jgi:hypothetical protein
MQYTYLYLALSMVLFNCIGDTNDKVSQLITNLKNQDTSVRYSAITVLENAEFSISESADLIKHATEKFPAARYEWESIPSLLIDAATKHQSEKLVITIANAYKDFDNNAAMASLKYLSSFDKKIAIETYVDLALKFPSKIENLPTGKIEEYAHFEDLLFPKLFTLLENKNAGSQIALLFLDYLDKGQLNPNKFVEHEKQFINISKGLRNQISLLQDKIKEIDSEMWDNAEYMETRWHAGIIADILGYFESKQSTGELQSYLAQKDKKLKMFAVVSLLKHKERVNDTLYEEIAADSETRQWFYDNLKKLGKDDLFPARFKTQEYFAESDMVNWLLYPTELARKPDSIQLMKTITVDTKGEDGVVDFFVFRFKSNDRAWVKDGWMAGISGYFIKKEEPTTEANGYTFSSFEKWESNSADEHLGDISDLIDNANEKNQ